MHAKRPGGLTALAVINFVFTGFNLIGVAGLGAMLAAGSLIDQPEFAEAAAMFEEFRGLLIISAVLSVLSALLLLVSGIGYLRQKRVTGRFVGSAYGIIALISGITSAAVLPQEAGGGLGIGTIFGLIYPLLTLFLVNVTFKDDLVN